MSYLTIETIGRSCAFILHIQNPTDALRRLAIFFEDRHIPINSLHMHRYENGNASLIIYCHIEKDRIRRTVQLLEQLPGILEIERMEQK